MANIDPLELQVCKQYRNLFLVFISSYDPFDGYNLYMIEPSGHVYAYYGYAHGKGR
jgi:20S proteasome alpha/beta subunit